MTTQNSRLLSSLSTSKLLSSTALTAASLAALAMPANAQSIPDNALPQGEVVTSGSADYDRSTQNVLKIKQNSGIVSADYMGGFNIGKNAAVLMDQKSSDKFVHIDKSDKVSIINGLFSGNGTNFVLNKDGVLIGEHATIDMGGFVAATGELGAGTDLAAGKIEINNFGAGAIDIKGGAQISVAEAGIAAFVSPTVRNDGVINAKLGKVAFAAGDKVTLDLYGDKLVEIAVNDKLADAIIEHTGTINAEGGTVTMTAQAAKEAVDNIINVTGVVTVASATQAGGKIILSGGEQGAVKVDGKLDASGATGGGEISVTGEGVILSETSELTADGTDNGNGGKIINYGNSYAIMSGRASAKGGANGGNGGFVELSAKEAVGFNGSVDTSAANGTIGRFLIDPENINLGDFSGLFETLPDLIVDAILGGDYSTIRIDDQALANTLRNTDVDLWATNKIYTSSDFDISTEDVGTKSIVTNDLSLSAKTINIDHNITLGKGNLTIVDTKAGESSAGSWLIDAPSDITVDTVNLNAKILTRATVGGATTLAGSDRIEGVADTVNVISNKASINQGIEFAQAGKTVNVGAGTYNESVLIDKSLTLKGANAGIDPNTGVRGAETVIAGTADPAVYITANDVTFDGFTVTNPGLDAIDIFNADNVAVQNNIIENAAWGIFAWGGTSTDGVIQNNKITNIDNHAIHIRENQYLDILDNVISDANVGITTENFYSASPTGVRALIDDNEVSAKAIGIRNNLSYGSQSGFTISNNTITAEDPSNTRRWTGIDVISQMGGVGTIFQGNIIDGSAVDATRQTAGFELTNMTNANRAVIDDGSISNVDVGVWATDGSFYTGAVSDLLIENVTFTNAKTGILVEDTEDALTLTGVNPTGTKISVGAGNSFIDSAHELAIAGDDITVALEGGFAGFNTTLVKAAGPANYTGNPYGTTTVLTTNNASINKGIGATASGGTVDVEAGTFTEQVNIGKNLNLIGAGQGSTIIQAPSTLGTVFTPVGYPYPIKAVIYAHDASDINISDLTVDGNNAGNANNRFAGIGYHNAGGSVQDTEIKNIQNSPFDGVQGGYGVFAWNDVGTNTLDVKNNNIHDFQKNGVMFGGTGLSGTISGNTITGKGATNLIAQNGIVVMNGANATIGGVDEADANTISGFGYAPSAWTASSILLYSAGNSTSVIGNKITGTGYDVGIYVSNTDSAIVSGNTIDGSADGIDVLDSDGVTISGNTISNSVYDGIWVEGGVGLTIDGVNTITNSGDDGIDIIDTTGVVSIKDNVIDGTTGGHESNGIAIEGTTGVTIDHNEIKNTDWNNINVAGATGTKIINNTLKDSESASGIGIWQGSDDTVIDANTITGSAFGIWNQGGNLEIGRNTISADSTGVYLLDTVSANIHNNFINNGATAGVHAAGSTGSVTVYDNSFTGNAKNIINATATMVQASFNWWGSNDETVVAGKITGSVDISPYQNAGTDTSEEVGYQGDLGDLQVTTLGAQTSGLIQEAIDLAEDGGDVQVNAGTYTENLLIDKALKLTGKAGAILEAATSGNLITVTADNVNIDPFVFDGLGLAAYGINATGADNLVIDGNTFLGFTEDSIHITDSNNVKVFGNTITGGKRGIYGDDTINIQGHTNTINGTTVAGIHIENSNGTGYDGGGNDVDLWSNTIAGAAGSTGILIEDSAYATVGWHPTNPFANALTGGNTITGGANGIVISGSPYGYVAHNKVSGQSNDGIQASANNNLTVYDNLVFGTGQDGIDVTGGKSVQITGNFVGYTDKLGTKGADNNVGADGIRINGNDFAVVSGNKVNGAGDDGIEVINATNSLIGGVDLASGNVVSRSFHDGITTEGGDLIEVNFNTVTDTRTASGVAIHTTTKADVEGNEITNAALLGIYGQNSHGIEILNNKVTNVGYNAPAGHPHGNGIGVESANGVTITGNTVNGARSNGISVGLAINNADGTSTNVTVDDNKVRATGTDGIVVAGGAVSVSGNTVNTTGGDGIDIRNSEGVDVKGNKVGTSFGVLTSPANGNIAGNGIVITDSNWAEIQSNLVIDAAGNGIYNNSSDNTTIGGAGALKNTITSVDGSGILVNPSFNVDVIGNTITGANEGVKLVGNTQMLVSGNVISDIETDGVQVLSNNGTLEILNNKINADGHGIYHGEGITSGDDIDVKGNTIVANEDRDTTGAGIFFDGTINGGTVDIGEGDGSSANSNKIVVQSNLGGGDGSTLDGIHFAKSLGANAKLVIDGNRIGYTGALSQSAVADDGIEFRSGVSGNADIKITDNYVVSLNDGIEFHGIAGDAKVLIGGSGDKNTIDADSSGVVGHGVLISGAVGGNALLTISYNEIDADQDGVHFAAAVSNGNNDATNDVIISNNDIWGRDNGVNFAFTVSGNNHDTLISGNKITGLNGDGVRFGGTVDNADIHIINNTNIIGGQDGVNFAGLVVNGALVEVNGNTRIEGDDDGVDFENVVTNSVVKINGNHDVIADDNGIEFAGVTGGSVEILANNAGITSKNHGIYFGGNIASAVVDIDDNLINANSDNSGSGDGIRFDGMIQGNSAIGIGDGDGSALNANASNVISGVDGIHFNDDIYNTASIVIDGNRIGYGGFASNPTSGSNTRVTDDGIQFADSVYDASNITITDNWIRSADDGVNFAGDAYGNGTILIGGSGDKNTIDAQGDGVEFNSLSGERQVEISYNTVTASGDGLKFGTVNNADASFPYSDRELLIASNTITGGQNGINFTGLVSGFGHDTLITGNKIDGTVENGIRFGDAIDDAEVRIVDNTDINGDNDGIQFNGQIRNNALVQIDGNTEIEGEDDDAINFVSDIISGSVVEITGNHSIVADDTADNGIEFAGVTNASVLISGNNAGIVADNHGITFGGSINNGDVEIVDNIIYADADGKGSGNGIHFASTVTNGSNILIGDGVGHAGLNTGASNIISGEDGIHFAGAVNGGSQIEIDGNRLGYEASKLSGPIDPERLDRNGIVFASSLSGGADVLITDNFIRAEQEGIRFGSTISGTGTTVVIGGVNDGNTIDANENGIEFVGSISGQSYVTVSHNTVDADQNGIVFRGETSNADQSWPYSESEILISNNDVEGGWNGIAFYGNAEGFRHDITIRDNVNISGSNGHGILFDGNIEDAELRIVNNGPIWGSQDGIHVEGYFYDDALIQISDNWDVDSGSGDGIEVTDNGSTSGAVLNITGNHVHYTGDNGIEVNNVDGAYIYNNDIHDTDGNGIEVTNSDDVEISRNDIEDAGENGIYVYNSDDVVITRNDIVDTDDHGIYVDGNFWNDNAEITWNDIWFAGDDGINVEGSAYSDIRNNDVYWSENDGIDVSDSDYVDVVRNHVHGTYEGAGIEVTDSYAAEIEFNDVHYTDEDGIYADNIDWGSVSGNDVYATGDDGIDVDDSAFVGVNGNTVRWTDGDGIEVSDSFAADINFNRIRDAGDDGIDVDDSDYADVIGNNIRRTDANGIELTSSDYADIKGNTVDYAGQNGIYVNPSSFVEVNGNFVNFADWDGIQVNGGIYNTASGNEVYGSGWSGIVFNGSDHFTIEHNIANNNGVDGIQVNGTYDGVVRYNTTNLNTGSGISLFDTDNIWVIENTANNNAIGLRIEASTDALVQGNGFGFNTLYGMLASSGNGVITLKNNVFNASPVGARFESGQINLSSLFDPNVFVGTGGTIGMQFDETGTPGSLTLIGDTIGSTIFTGFLPIGSFYVRFEDGTLLDTVTGEPIVIDGLNANFDGLVPALQGGFLTPAQLAFLESRIYDADDLVRNGRGQLFVGRVPTEEDLGLENLEDFFNRYGTPDDGSSGFSVTVRGLPNVTAAGLNALTPAAGVAGPAGLAGIEPAAGEEGVSAATAPQDIEPEAGNGENVSCWSDAVSAGTTTTFSFGGSFEDSIAGAGSCGSGSI